MSNIIECGYGGNIADTNLAFATGYGITSGNQTTSKFLVTSTGWGITGTLAVSGVSYLANGTAALPSLAFTNSTTSGFYRAGADIWGFSLAAVPAFTIASTEPTVAAAAATAGTAVWFKGTNGGASTGATAAGRGSNMVIASGDGGAAAGSGAGGDGGNVIVDIGAGGTSGSGTAGGSGSFMIKGTAPAAFIPLSTRTALTDADATLTALQLRGQIISVAAGANNRTLTLPTAAQLVGAFTNIQVGSRIDVCVVNLKAANTVTVAVASGVTAASGSNLVVAAQASAQFTLLFTNVTASSEAVDLIRTAG